VKSTDRPMTFAQLAEFVPWRMRMSHIYQPLLIKALVDSSGRHRNNYGTR
jgi:hypothetical protein